MATNQLNAQDMQILKSYADSGERQAYWSYLTAKGDPYAKLALQVVQNSTLDGYVANYYASAVAAQSGIRKTPEEWNDVGVRLMNADLGFRSALVDDSKGENALYLGIDPITKSHQTAFAASGLSLDTWTAWAPIKSDYQSGNLAAAQGKFNAMVQGGFVNTASTVGSGAWSSPTWAANVGQAGVSYSLTGADPISNPNYVKGYSYDGSKGQWYSAGTLVAAGGPTVAPSDLAAQLNAERIWRIALTGQGITDPNLNARTDQATLSALAGSSGTGNSLPITYTSSTTAIIGKNGTLSHIIADQNAKGNNITLEELRLFNSLTPSQDTKLQVGQQLLIPTKSADQLKLSTDDMSYSLDSKTGEHYTVVRNPEDGTSILLQRYKDAQGDYVDRYAQMSADNKLIAETISPAEGGTTHHEYNPATGSLLETRSSYAGTDAYGESYALTTTTGQDSISHLSVSHEDGSTTALDTNNASERNAAGLYSKEEIGERLEQFGLADSAQFDNSGFSGTGAANASLDNYQFNAGGEDYYFINGDAGLSVSSDSAYGPGVGDDGQSCTVSGSAAEAIGDMGGATNWVSPLILDLDGDGVAADLTHAYTENVYFDIDNDNFAERVGWSNGQDGLLAYDGNGNGKIDNITELFGDDQMAAFQKLRGWDSNGDGEISASDKNYSKLRLWQDTNRNGRTDQGELITLDKAGVLSISVADQPYLQSPYASSHGITSAYAQENYLSSATTFQMVDATGTVVTREIADVHFMNDNLNTWQLGAQGLDAAIGGVGNDVLWAGSRGAAELAGEGTDNDRSGPTLAKKSCPKRYRNNSCLRMRHKGYVPI